MAIKPEILPELPYQSEKDGLEIINFDENIAFIISG
jgi:hypothetical protein